MLACIATFWMKRKRKLPFKTFFCSKLKVQYNFGYFILDERTNTCIFKCETFFYVEKYQ